MTEPRNRRVSVVITNWNYANYLGVAIDSALAQSRSADEVIVVDDGSTDGSRALIETYGSRIKPVFGANVGQAGAFGRGFAASTGDIILFLDADDALKPECIETVLMAWHPSYAGICWQMEQIDRAGIPSGLYPERAQDFDKRPLLVESGSFPFMPTSGNAFARRVVERAMPFPGDRWRISADAYLLRIAALEGRILPLQQVLACYRVHPANNYYRVGASRLWLNRRGMRDVADLAGYFADWPHLGGDAKRQAAERLRLQIAAVRGQLALNPKYRQGGVQLRRLARRFVITAGAPLLPRLFWAFAAFCLSLGLWRVPAIQDWLRFPHERPAWVRRLLDGPGRWRLKQYLGIAKTPRWRSPTPLDTDLDPIADPAAEACLGAGWTTPRLAGLATSPGRRATLLLALAPTPSAITVEAVLEAPQETEAHGFDVEASLDGEVLSRATIFGRDSFSIPLPAGSASRGAEVAVDLTFGRAQGSADEPERLGRLRGQAPPVTLVSLKVSLDCAAIDPAAPLEARPQRFADLITPGSEDWEVFADGAAQLIEPTGAARVTALANAPALIEMLMPAAQPPGWMRIAVGGEELYSGAWGEGDRLWCRLPLLPEDSLPADFVVHELTFTFTPDDPFDTQPPVLSAIVLHPERSDPLPNGLWRIAMPPVNPGQLLTYDEGDPGREALTEEWMTEGSGPPVLPSGDGGVRFFIPPGLHSAEAALSLDPVFAGGQGQVQLVSILVGDAVLARVQLHGESDVAVPLSVNGEPLQGEIQLTLRSLYATVDESRGDLAAGGRLTPAPVRLRSVAISGTWAPRPESEPSPRQFPGHIEQLLAASTEAPVATRAALSSAIKQADERTLSSALATPDTLATLRALGSSATDASHPLLGKTTAPAGTADRLRELIVAMSSLPAFELPYTADLTVYPEPFLWWPAELAAWLIADPGTLDAAAAARYEDFVLRLYRSIDHVVATEPPGGARAVLALEVLGNFLPRRLLFGKGSILEPMRAIGAATERHLTLQGYPLVRTYGPRPDRPKLRVGVILRVHGENPETRIARAMVECLDPERFEPMLIVQEPGAPGEPGIVPMGNLTVGESVNLIRGLDLDVAILGSFFNRADLLAAIVAHRLAPVQLATTAVTPVTTGLASFDGILGSDLVEPADAESHYFEPLIRVAGPVQAFSTMGMLPPDPMETATVARRRLGLPLDATLLVSGAMMQKIGAGLMTAWAEVLAATPGAKLVLYPFAPNWRLDYAANAFERWARSVLAGKGVEPERLVILERLTPVEVRRLLIAADLYLDSFPYAGAATVTEALDQGLPVVALRGNYQRGRQGAGWLQAFGLAADIAVSIEAYVARAIALAGDAVLRRSRRALLESRLAAGAPHSDLKTFGETLSRVLIDAAAAKGITLKPRPPTPVVHPGPYRYLFHHMPKAGGTSSIRLFRDWFKIVRDYREGWSEKIPDPANLAALDASHLICGHFELPELRLTRRYPEIIGNPEWRLFSIVRDPLELSLSGYFFENEQRAGEPRFTPITLTERLREQYSDYRRHFDCDETNWREVLDRYWFIGTAERLDECLAYLASEFGQAPPDVVPSLNATPRTEKPDLEDVEFFARRMALDYEIYNEIRARLDRRLRKG